MGSDVFLDQKFGEQRILQLLATDDVDLLACCWVFIVLSMTAWEIQGPCARSACCDVCAGSMTVSLALALEKKLTSV